MESSKPNHKNWNGKTYSLIKKTMSFIFKLFIKPFVSVKKILFLDNYKANNNFPSIAINCYETTFSNAISFTALRFGGVKIQLQIYDTLKLRKTIGNRVYYPLLSSFFNIIQTSFELQYQLRFYNWFIFHRK